jgi:hypothetical protein
MEQKRLFPDKNIISIDFERLLQEVANGYEIIEAVLYADPHINDSFWGSFMQQNFPVKFYNKYFQNLVIDGVKILVTHKNPAILIILSGDSEFTPTVEIAKEEKWETEVWGFYSSISRALADMVTRVKTLDDVFEKIGKYE